YYDSHASFELQKYLLLYTPHFSTLLLLETDLHVYGLVLRVQRFMNAHGPAHGAGKELSGIVHKLLGVIGVVRLTFTQSPRCLHPSLGLCVESYDLQLTHLVEVAFDDVQVVVHGAFVVVEPGVVLDLNRHVAAAAVKLAHIFKVAEKTHRVDGLAKRHVDERRDFADGNCRVAFPVDTGGGINPARRHRDDGIHLNFARSLLIRRRGKLRRHARVGRPKRGLQVPTLQVHGEQVKLSDRGER